jgi:hypothetical protein
LISLRDDAHGDEWVVEKGGLGGGGAGCGWEEFCEGHRPMCHVQQRICGLQQGYQLG